MYIYEVLVINIFWLVILLLFDYENLIVISLLMLFKIGFDFVFKLNDDIENLYKIV